MAKKILALTGMPGSGKTEAAKFFRSKNFPVISLGRVILKKLDAENLQHTQDNERRIREKLRQELGMAACAIKIIPKLKKILKKRDIVVLEGLRSWEERQFLKKHVPDLVVIALIANSGVRYQRLSNRPNRSLDPNLAIRRDMRELAKLNICPTILLADKFIVNEGTKEQFYKQLQKIVKEFYEDG